MCNTLCSKTHLLISLPGEFSTAILLSAAVCDAVPMVVVVGWLRRPPASSQRSPTTIHVNLRADKVRSRTTALCRNHRVEFSIQLWRIKPISTFTCNSTAIQLLHNWIYGLATANRLLALLILIKFYFHFGILFRQRESDPSLLVKQLK